jgi:hypothetical protein
MILAQMIRVGLDLHSRYHGLHSLSLGPGICCVIQESVALWLTNFLNSLSNAPLSVDGFGGYAGKMLHQPKYF